MPGPFPGMDPYLEHPAIWPDVHFHLIAAIHHQLQPQVLPRYYVSAGERVYLEDARYSLYPDMAIVRPQPYQTRESAVATVEPDEPLVVVYEARPREPFLEIRSASSHEIVTVIEVLSPANKAGGRGGEEYRSKRERVLQSPAHPVEIDLLRVGSRAEEPRANGGPSLSRFDYLVTVSRAPAREQAEVYPFTIRDRLPRVRIPLKHPDPDVTLDLPAALAATYDIGAYAIRLDYRRRPSPPLRQEDEGWANELLQEVAERAALPPHE